MKKISKLVLLIFASCLIFSLSVLGLAGDSFSWYCKRNSEHLQPQIDSKISFIEDYSGYYVDKKYTDSDEKVIYLTFDAGYENGNIEKILNILKQENVPASFFVLENLVEKNSELICRMVEDGHLVCNHTASHKDVSYLSRDELKAELERLGAKFKEKVGSEMPKYFRPPEGRFSLNSMKLLDELGYKTVFWSFAYADWDNNQQMSREKALEKIMSNIHNGEIMLLHPTSRTNVEILPELIKQLKDQGYKFKTVDNL